MKELYKNTWAELDRGVRIFLLAGDEKALVIDTGMTGPDIRTLVSAHTNLPFTLLNTHADRDHIGGNFQFDTFYAPVRGGVLLQRAKRQRQDDAGV